MIPTKAKDAAALGLKYYAAPKPCKRGHQSLRCVKSGVCMDCHYERKAAKRTPRTQARQEAIRASQPSYHGAPCCRCGNTERHTNNTHCRSCY